MTHEAGETARSFFEAMKEQPIILGLIVTIFGMLGFIFYDRHDSFVARNQFVKETTDMLSRCLTVEEVVKLEQSLRRQP